MHMIAELAIALLESNFIAHSRLAHHNEAIAAA
jgi:hypothetical protein